MKSEETTPQLLSECVEIIGLFGLTSPCQIVEAFQLRGTIVGVDAVAAMLAEYCERFPGHSAGAIRRAEFAGNENCHPRDRKYMRTPAHEKNLSPR